MSLVLFQRGMACLETRGQSTAAGEKRRAEMLAEASGGQGKAPQMRFAARQRAGSGGATAQRDRSGPSCSPSMFQLILGVYGCLVANSRSCSDARIEIDQTIRHKSEPRYVALFRLLYPYPITTAIVIRVVKVCA